MATSIGKGGGVKQGLDYYKKQNKQENYYIKKGAIGYLWGQGITDIGLKEGQELNLKTFKKLLQGYHPTTSKKLTRVAGKNRKRAYFDVTNSPPKSFSILVAQLESRGEIEKALFFRDLHEKANQKAMQRIQKNFGRTRISTGKKNPETGKSIIKQVKADGLMYATIQHDVAREVEGKIDPQIHSHNVLFNQVTRVDEDGNIKTTALHNDEIYKNRVSIELEYNTYLATLMKENGVEIKLTNTKRGEWEIADFDREQVMEFSSRRKLIERLLPEYMEKYPKKTEDELKDLIVLESKKAKQEIDMEKLLFINRERMEKAGISDKFIDDILKDLGTKDLTVLEEEIKQKIIRTYVDRALGNVTERHSVFTVEHVMVQAMQQSGLHGFNFDRDEMEKTFDRMALDDVDLNNPLQLVELGEQDFYRQYSTRDIIEAEQEILKASNQHLAENKKEPFFADKLEIKNLVKDKELALDVTYSKGQKELIMAVLGSDNRYINAQGDAGSGKTFSVTCFVDVLKQHVPDLEILGLSYQGKAVSILGEEAGINVKTLHSHLGSEKIAKEKGKWGNKPRLIIVDENTMAGSLQIRDLIENANERGDTILFMGDKKQLQSLSAGSTHDDMQKFGMETIELNENIRQKTKFGQDVVQGIKDKDFEKVFDLLEKGEKVKEIGFDGEEIERFDQKMFEGSISEMIDKLVSDYKSDYKKYGEATQLYSARNINRRVINLQVREIEKTAGRVEADDNLLSTLEQITLQGIEREVAENYEEDTLITINTAIEGFKGGSKAIVLHAKKGSHNVIVTQREGDGKIIEINLSDIQHKNIGLYKQKEKKFSVGEKIKYTKNDARGLGVKNGDADIIVTIDGNNITTKKGKTFSVEQYPYLDYSYCVSIHNSQGMTAKRGRALADSDMITLNNFYVQGTRNKLDVHFYMKSIKYFKINSMIAEENPTTLKFVTQENVAEFLNKTNQKGKEHGKDITRENGRDPQRTNGQDARDQEDRARELEPVDNTKEREHAISSGGTSDLSSIDGRRARGQSTGRAVGRIAHSNTGVVKQIELTLQKVDELISRIDKMLDKKPATQKENVSVESKKQDVKSIEDKIIAVQKLKNKKSRDQAAQNQKTKQHGWER